MGDGGDALTRGGHVGGQADVPGGAVVCRKLVRAVLLVDLDFFAFGDEHELRFAGDRVGGAPGQQTGARQRRQFDEPAAGNHGFVIAFIVTRPHETSRGLLVMAKTNGILKRAPQGVNPNPGRRVTVANTSHDIE